MKRNTMCRLAALVLAIALLLSTAAVSADTVTGNLEAKGRFYTDYTTIDEARVVGEQLNIQVASEGFVLLKNRDGALPLSAGERNVTPFGMRSAHLQLVGGGSGAGDGFGHEWTLKESLEDAGFNVNPKTFGYYASFSMGAAKSGAAYELDPTSYEPFVIGSYRSYGDAVIWVISRTGAEGADLLTANVPGHADPAEHYLELDDNEKLTYAYLKEKRQQGVFGKLIVIVNSANAMELGDMQDDDDVDAIIWVGHPGNAGIAALGRILTGEVNPSGRLADIYARDLTKDPTWTNFGSNVHMGLDNYVYCDGEDTGYRSTEYREGIYIGYRWYETVAADMGEAGESWYAENVVYPFGFGLSYTSFEWKLADTAEEAAITSGNDVITVNVEVTNTGAAAGKDVVQVYVEQPYTAGGIEKAAKVLAGYAKTKLLQPGESEIVTVSFSAQSIASYDYSDANGNGFKGYELEAGDYTIDVSRNSHEAVASVKRTVADGILCKTDEVTGREIGNVFSGGETVNGKNVERFKTTNAALEANQATREGGLKQPAASTEEDRTISEEKLEFYNAEETFRAWQDQETDPWYVTSVPATWTQSTVPTETIEVTIEGTPVRTTKMVQHADGSLNETLLRDMSGIAYQEPVRHADGSVTEADDEGTQAWTAFMNQLTYEEMASICTQGYYVTIGLPSIAKSEGVDSDGPSQVKAGFYNRTTPGGTLWACGVVIASTFNDDLAYEIGLMCGNEALFLNLSGWYGPGLEIHRSPFGGRNFEYYSEDGVLAGRVASSLIRGAVEKGTHVYMKHMTLNNQEANRNTQGGIFMWCNEQAIREIYIRPYEYSVKYGHANGAMSGMNRVGDSCCYTNFAMLNALLRDEWGFQGAYVTDTLFNSSYHTFDMTVRAGQDIPLGVRPGGYAEPLSGEWNAEQNTVLIPADEESEENTVPSYTQWFAVRMAAQHILYTIANNGDIHNGMTEAAFTDMTVTLNEDGSLKTSVANPDATAGAYTVKYYTRDELPKSLKLDTDGSLSGTPAEGETFEGFSFVVRVLADDYVNFHYTVTIAK